MAGAAVALGSSFFAGRMLWRTGEWPVQFALGAAVFGHLVWVLGVLGAFSAWAFAGLAVGLGGVSLWRAGVPKWSGTPRWTWLVAGALGIFLFCHANGPAVQPDEVTYHLGLVREWLREGRFPGRVGFYEAMPQLGEMLFAVGYGFGGAAGAKLVSVGVLGALAGLAARMGGGGARGAAAAVLVAASPVVMITGTAAYNDVMLALFALAVYRAVEREEYGWAGLLAGACYAVKMTGGVVAAGALVWVLARRGGWRRFVAGACVFPAPWLVRNVWLAGNPFAPLLNAWFPNEHFHASTEATLRQYLSTYDVQGWERVWQLLVGGGVLGGHVGVGFVVAPLAVWGLRRKERRGRVAAMLVAAVVAAAPWMLNAGTRFLIPALPFVALAVPGRAVWVAGAVQGAMVVAAGMGLGVPEGAWALRGWTAKQEMPEAGVARLLAQETRRGERVLDLVAAPMAYMDAVALAPWGHVAADRAVAALTLAQGMRDGLLYEMRADWQPARVRRVRVVLGEGGPQSFRVQEMRVLGMPAGCVSVGSRHTLETPLVWDGNVMTGWSTWAKGRAGDGVTVECGEEFESTGVRATVAMVWQGMKVRVEGDGQVLNADPGYARVAPLNWRRAAMEAVRREGFRWVLVRDSGEGYGVLGSDFVARRGDWGLELGGVAGNVYLWRVP